MLDGGERDRSKNALPFENVKLHPEHAAPLLFLVSRQAEAPERMLRGVKLTYAHGVQVPLNEFLVNATTVIYPIGRPDRDGHRPYRHRCDLDVKFGLEDISLLERQLQFLNLREAITTEPVKPAVALPETLL
jgi:hypothetical protein